MKIVNIGNTLRIFTDDLTVEDKIPVGTYRIEFSQMTGYSLSKVKNFEHTGKVYGRHLELVDKMIDRYTKSDRNFGAILGGRKGTGKSLSARILSEKLRSLDIPTILVTENTPGLPRFLQSIEQPVLILIDEFEKIFIYDQENNEDDQSQFLSIFDGMTSNRHFYLITINDYDRLNPYFQGRTGRFYYDITFDRLTLDEIHHFMIDNAQTYEASNRLTSLLYRLNTNYDQLTAVSRELNFGETIENILAYLNIGLNGKNEQTYDMIYFLKDGVTKTCRVVLDLINPFLYCCVDIQRKVGHKKAVNYNMIFSAHEDAFVFVDDRVEIDLTKIKDIGDANADYLQEDENGEVYYGTFADLEAIVLRPVDQERKIAY